MGSLANQHLGLLGVSGRLGNLESETAIGKQTMEDSCSQAAGPANRIALRYEFETQIRVRLERGNRHAVVGGWTRDISESGLSAFVAERLEVGELVTLHVPLGESTETIPARVARGLGTQHGFQFLALSAHQPRGSFLLRAAKWPFPCRAR